MSDTRYLDWPLFEERHRALAIELDAWAATRVVHPARPGRGRQGSGCAGADAGQLGASCFGNYVREVVSRTQIPNGYSRADCTSESLFAGYGYLTWTDNEIAPKTFWASGYPYPTLPQAKQ